MRKSKRRTINGISSASGTHYGAADSSQTYDAASQTVGAYQSLSQIKFSARYRRPLTMVPRTAARTTQLQQSNYLPTVRPPYNNASLDRFEDCFRSDKLVQNGVVKRVELVLGQHGKIVMDTTKEFDNEDDRATALEQINNNQQYKDARDKIQQLIIKPGIDFHTHLKSAVIQSKVYGRAAIEMVGTDDDGLPTSLHVLNSKRLANVEIEPQTWEFLGVHYLDLSKGPSGNDDILPAENLIYFANRDFHVSPGSLYYGLSELEGIIDGSDSKRIAKQEDIKEIMKSNWAPFLIMKFLNPNISIQQMQEVVNGIQPGLPFSHKQDIETQTVSLEANLKEITDAIDFLNRESLRELGVPGFISGYEQIVNYANSQQILLSFREIELEAERTWVSNIIELQFLNRLFYQLLNIDPTTDGPEVKLKYTYGDISFETTLDKVNGALLLFDRQLITGEKVLEVAGYEDQIEEYKLMQQQRELEQKQMQQQMMQQPPELGPFGRPLQPNQVKYDQLGQRQLHPGQKNEGLQNQAANQTESQRLKAVSTTVRKRQGSTEQQQETEEEALQYFSDALKKITDS